MNFSIDTNIIFGIINPDDRIHNKSVELFKNKQGERLFICHTAIKEAKTSLRNKINEIVVDIITCFKDIYKSDLSPIELQSLIIKEIKKIMIRKPRLKNFLEWVYKEISDFLMTHDKENLASYLSELSIRLSRSIELILKRIRPDYQEIYLNLASLEDVKKAAAGVYFRNSSDERIFYELMTNLNEILPIEFYLDDGEFLKKCEAGYLKLANDLSFDEMAFSCKLISV